MACWCPDFLGEAFEKVKGCGRGVHLPRPCVPACSRKPLLTPYGLGCPQSPDRALHLALVSSLVTIILAHLTHIRIQFVAWCKTLSTLPEILYTCKGREKIL